MGPGGGLGGRQKQFGKFGEKPNDISQLVIETQLVGFTVRNFFFFLCNLRKENEYISFWDDKNKEKCIVVSMRHLRRDTGIEMKVWLLYCFNTRCVWKLLISITFFYTIPRKHMNWLWTYVGLRTSGFEGNNPAPVWYRTPVLNIISTYLKELTVSTSIRKERMYVKFVRRPIRGTE